MMGILKNDRIFFKTGRQTRFDMRISGDPVIIKAHESHIPDVKFSPDGQTLLSAGMDYLVKLWSVPDWKLLGTLSGHEKSVNVLNLTSDGRWLYTASSDMTVRKWEIKTRTELKQLDVKGKSARLSPDEGYLAVMDNPWVKIISLDKEETIQRFKPFPKRTTALAFSAQSPYLAVGGQGDDILIYEFRDIKLVHTIADAHKGYVLSLSFSPDGEQLVSTGYEKSLCFWDTGSWELAGEIPLENQGVQSLAFSPSGKHLAVASDHRITLISTQAMEIIQIIDLKPKGIYCLAFSPDGNLLACGGADKRIRIWTLDS